MFYYLKSRAKGHGCINIVEQVLTINGHVKEVRTFLGFVTLFVSVYNPEELSGKIVKITLSNDNCQRLLTWSQLVEDTEIKVTRRQNDGIPRNRTYSLEVLKSQVVDMDDIR